MDGLLNDKAASDDDNYYELLGCDERSTPEQIATEYKILAKKYHPDKAGVTDKTAAEKHFVRIERAKEVLLDKEMRRKYDEWRRGGFKRVVSFRKWLDMQPQVHQSMHWSQPERELPSLQSNERTENTTASQPDGTSLEQFRRGSSGSNHLSQFRTYGV